MIYLLIKFYNCKYERVGVHIYQFFILLLAIINIYYFNEPNAYKKRQIFSDIYLVTAIKIAFDFV